MLGYLVHDNTRYPARISRVAFNGIFAPPYSSEVTHTASIPVTDDIKQNDTVTDSNGATYRVMSRRVILNKLRLELNLQYA